MLTIHNPILPGFRPDPSICRVGGDYFIANSTFEWFPGVALSRSRDLRHWQPIGHVLTRPSQVDLRGRGDSLGLWAPSLSFDGERFYCVVCDVRTRSGPHKDMHNLLFVADEITGPWSDPIDLGGCGFDPSIFHHADGSKWHLNIQWDHRDNKPRFGGIVLQRLEPQTFTPAEPVRTIFRKPVLIEGPNLYERDGWFYLMCAEGGTGWNHGISLARSRRIEGPYEPDPEGNLLTTRQSPDATLQKAGHGELVRTPSGEWFLVHLASRPVYPERRCILGRETCLQSVRWMPDGWLRLEHGGQQPADTVEVDLPEQPWPTSNESVFARDRLGPEWQSPRRPITQQWCSLTSSPGCLRLQGGESLHSLYEPSLVAQRLTSLRATIETELAFDPSHFTQAAGLVVWYDTRGYFYLRVTHDEERGRVLGVTQTDDGIYSEHPVVPIPHTAWKHICLRAEIHQDTLQFSASPDGNRWEQIGPPLDMTSLSDDYGSAMRFTGAMVGLTCQDLNRSGASADFLSFSMCNTQPPVS